MVQIDYSHKRMWQFDFLKFLSAFLVIFGHALLHYGYPRFDHPLCSFIYSFHMPLFMVMSGYFSHLHTADNLLAPVGGGNFLLRRTISYCIPYITMEVISLLLSYSIGISVNSWFLMSVFLNYIVVLIIKRFVKINRYTSVLLIIMYLISAPILFRYYKMIYLFPFFVLGIMVRSYWEILLRYKTSIFYICLILYIFSFYNLWDKSCIYDVDSKRWIYRDNGIIFSIPILLTYLTRYAIGSFASLSIIFGVFKLHDHGVFRRIAFYGLYSLELYIIGLYLDRFRFVLDFYNEFLYSIECLLLAVVISFTCIILSKQIKRLPLLDLLIFGKGRVANNILNQITK